MERKTFIRTCGLACMGGTLLTTMLEGCSSTKMVTGTIADTDLVVPAAVFVQKGDRYRRYVVVQHEQLAYPICLYRFSESRYSALLMRCTHQGTELQVFGDRLQCPAHGSEFSNQGAVQNGPADTDLRRFPVTVQNNEIYISMKK
jgi:Rieske Fe-S protein